MTSIELNIIGAVASAKVCGKLTGGMVGIPVSINYDRTWDGLSKTLVCKSGDAARSIIDVQEPAVVAHEVMIAGRTLFLGVEGRNADGTLVIPTVWAYCGMIFAGANADADPSADPTPPIWAQLQAEIEALKQGSTGGGSISVKSEDDALIITTTLPVSTEGDAIVIGGV